MYVATEFSLVWLVNYTLSFFHGSTILVQAFTSHFFQ